ncbi:retrovirus-related pol polyprotein from transposon TNT 1-94 [Tanacetum coccineum]
MNDKCTMSEAIERGNLAWPNEWIEKFPVLKNYGVPNLNVLKIANADHGDNLGFNLLCGNIFGNGMNSHGSLKIANADHVDNLGFNLLSVGQICDSKCKVLFTKNDSEIIKDDKVIGHANMRLIQSLASKELVRNPPKLKFDRHFYDACKIGKQAHASHKAKKLVSTSICLELLHVDLFGPSVVRSYGGNLYTFVIVNDYSRNKLDENGVITRNKARLVAQGYNQQECIDYDETYAPIPKLESIRILLANASALDFKLYQLDVKNAFLNGLNNEEVYVAQPPGFIDFEKPDHVYKHKKTLYGLKQAPKAWRCVMNLPKSCMMSELNFFLGLQIKQMEDGIFFNQSKYIKEMFKKFGIEDSKPMKTPMSSDIKLTKDEVYESMDSTKYRGMIVSLLYLTASTTHLGLWYPKGTDIETKVYADSDHAGDYVDQKGTSICMFLVCCLTSWFSKKQTALAISMTKAEYVSAGKACQQALWMKPYLIDYDICLDDVPIMCDNKGVIDLSKILVQRSRTKHIEICHHFLLDNVQKGHITIEKVSSKDNIADILTKPLKLESFNYLRLGLGMMQHIP